MTIDERTITGTAARIREHLTLLERERATAVLEGLSSNDLYMEDLRDELETMRSAYIGAAVTEIALLRSALNGRLLG